MTRWLWTMVPHPLHFLRSPFSCRRAQRRGDSALSDRPDSRADAAAPQTRSLAALDFAHCSAWSLCSLLHYWLMFMKAAPCFLPLSAAPCILVSALYSPLTLGRSLFAVRCQAFTAYCRAVSSLTGTPALYLLSAALYNQLSAHCHDVAEWKSVRKDLKGLKKERVIPFPPQRLFSLGHSACSHCCPLDFSFTVLFAMFTVWLIEPLLYCCHSRIA